MRLFLLAILTTIAGLSSAQDCNLSIRGRILEKGSTESLPFSTVYLDGKQKGTIADIEGYFEISGLCPGEYHLRFSHIGCTPEDMLVVLSKDTTVSASLGHHPELLDEIVVHGSNENSSSQVSNSIALEEIAKNSNKSLSELLETITGVSSLKGGSGLSKPVIHGMYGNRVAILNNGIAQSGQQWGNDHAPEIDPFVADHLSVVKGASALAYGGNSLGSIVLVEPGEVTSDDHLHGNINYILQTNGWGHTLNTRLERSEKSLAWRFTGTMKQIGDRQSPEYYLTNTGNREVNAALQVASTIREHWETRLYYSIFSTRIGILRGSHIGNLTDLQEALQRDKPFFTADKFSYEITAPRQEVIHHLLKVETERRLTDLRTIRFSYGGQWNNRQEFDVRRGGQSDIPSLSLNQYSHFLEGVLSQALGDFWFTKAGVQTTLVDNANDPETGISPLIPWYTSIQPAGFLILQRETDQWFYEVGGRYDFRKLNVSAISDDLPRRIEEFGHSFHNMSASTGLRFQQSEDFRTTFNLGYMFRSPEVNELYSSGLHQGVSGIEEGNRNLVAEKSLKAVFSIDGYIRDKMLLQWTGYAQRVNDFIYLQPQDEFRLTIRGAFPLFFYEQADANIRGTDLQLTLEPAHSFKVIGKYSVVRGSRVSGEPLVNFPSDNLSTELKYSLKEGEKFRGSYLSLAGRYVWRQNPEINEQDFMTVPADYLLIDAGFSTSLQLRRGVLDLSIRAENLLNQSYRDYLNRLRYFALDMGRNVSIRLNYSFTGGRKEGRK